MAAAISSQREISLHSDRSPGTPISGDKEISEATLENLASFILDNDYELNYDSQTLRNLKIKPLTCDEIKFGIRLINGHPLIAVVEDKENISISGRTRITMERTIYIKDLHRFGIASDSGLALGSLEAGASIKIVTVAQVAWDALNRYKAKLERDAYAPRYSFSNYGTGYHSLHDPVERISCSLVAKACTGLCCCLGITGAALYGIINHISNSLSEIQD